MLDDWPGISPGFHGALEFFFLHLSRSPGPMCFMQLIRKQREE